MLELALLLSCLITLSYIISPDALDKFMIDRGPVEHAQVIILLMAVIIAGKAILNLKGRMKRLPLVLPFTAGVFFLLGEESEWGRHYLHFSTPDSISQINRYGSFNLHNIPMFETLLNPAVLMVLAVICPFIYMRILGYKFSEMPGIIKDHLPGIEKMHVVIIAVMAVQIMLLTIMMSITPVHQGSSWFMHEDEYMETFGALLCLGMALRLRAASINLKQFSDSRKNQIQQSL